MAFYVLMCCNAQNPLHTFSCNVCGEVANLLPASGRCNGIWETTRHNRLLPAPTCYRLDADLSFMLRNCFGLAAGKSPTWFQLVVGKLWCNGFWPLRNYSLTHSLYHWTTASNSKM